MPKANPHGATSKQPTTTSNTPFSLEALLYLVPLDSTPESMKTLDLKRRSIASLPVQIKMFQHLRKLDLSYNALSSCRPLAPLLHLAHLNVCDNQLTSLEGLEAMRQLTVLQASNNRLTTLRGIDGCVGTLKALIANGNQLSLVQQQHTKGGDAEGSVTFHENAAILARMALVETVVLSRNPLLAGFKAPDTIAAAGGDQAPSEAPTSSPETDEAVVHPLSVFASMPQLRKLSLSECQIATLPLRWFLPLAIEVRLAHNHIATLPDGVIMRSVKTLDMSNNRIHSIVALRRCKYLQNLSLHGNPVTTSTEHHDLADDATQLPWWTHVKTHMILSRMFTELQVLDGHKFVPLTKASYLEKKHALQQAHEARSNAAQSVQGAAIPDDLDVPNVPAVPGKRPRGPDAAEELPDVVLEVPEAQAPRNIVRRERTVPQQQILRNTTATGSAAMAAILNKTRSHAPTAW